MKPRLEVTMRLRTGVVLMAIGAIFGARQAAADSTFCLTHYAPGTAGMATAIASGFWLCADAGTSGAVDWGSNVIQPDAASASPVSASQAGSAGGVFAAAASASSIADPGRLRAQAYGEAIASPPQDGFTFARGYGAASASIYEAGTLTPVGGGVLGDPVALRLTLDVHGAFGGNGDGDGELMLFRNGFVQFERDIFLYRDAPVLFAEHDFAGFQVGDSVAVYMRIRATAGGQNSPGAPTTSVADMSNTGKFFLDVRSSNAVFASTSGFDYRSVPEPSFAPLVAAGLVALALRRRAGAERLGARERAFVAPPGVAP